ncbi:ParB and winged helix-turn-helix domain-containing protein [Streptomyces sp. NPDC091272]|uniref:ParB and winged helix-turn-helix domain-containing protein n=1 Tax=Streptomyces sp. NPDC091272 TaxID=3365981 RepID=UPI0038262B97
MDVQHSDGPAHPVTGPALTEPGDALVEEGVHQVPIGVLRPADSPRMGENLQHARTLGASGSLSPILVHRPTMRVIDGMHRLRAAIMQQQDVIEAQFFDGTPEEAYVLAVRSNMSHGMPLTLAERAAAAARIMITHPHWSDRAISSVAGLDPKTVGALRRRGAEASPGPAVRVGQDGRLRPVNPASGRQAAGRLLAKDPDASLRDIARRAGISPGTVRDVRDRLARGEDPVPPALRAPTGARPAPAPRPPRATTRTPWPAGAPAATDLASVVVSLRKDPSLRQTESGRLLLRLLEMHLTPQWRRITESVPPHRAGMVATAALECAKAWQEFAEKIQRTNPT